MTTTTSATDLIRSIDGDLSYHAKRSEVLELQKQRLQTIEAQYPGAELTRNIICVKDSLNQARRMRIEPFYMMSDDRKHWIRHLTVKFPLDLPTPVRGYTMYAAPFRQSVAKIIYDFTSTPRRGVMTVADYTQLIPTECKSRDRFVERIRAYVERHCVDYKYEVSNDSFDVASLQKLTLLF